MFYLYADLNLRDYISDFVQEVTDSISLFLYSQTDNTLIGSLSKYPLVLVLILLVFALAILFSLILCAYLMGSDRFIKVNLTFGSLFIIFAGIALAVLSLVFRRKINLGGNLAFLEWILFTFGLVVGLVSIAGCFCGLYPKTCWVPLHIYTLFLVIITGVLVVFGLINLFFPALFWDTIFSSVVSSCVDFEATHCLCMYPYPYCSSPSPSLYL